MSQARAGKRASGSSTLSAGTTRLSVEIGRVEREHQDALCAALSPREREQLADLLFRVAEQQGLTPGVHPGFRKS